MKNLILIVILSFLWILNSPCDLTAQNSYKFKFRKDRTFRIAQFTDIHWDPNFAENDKTVATINHVLNTEKPDLVVLSGDIVTAPPARKGWDAICAIFEKAKMPFAVVLGNHDAEANITREEIFEYIQKKPYFVGSKGPDLYGCGNYVLPIKSSDDKKVASMIYFLDSNDYPKDKKIGHYDWIHYDQIGWYRATSDGFTAQNNGMPLPSLMYFHIPLIEFNNVVGKETTVGAKNEGIAAGAVNSGMFASLAEKKDVMGVFVGHDHDNNFIGIDHDIALAFGQVTGADAYGDLERGSRIVELHEDEFRFDTWIRTASGVQYKYNYPSGLATDAGNTDYLPAKKLNGLKQGVSFSYFEGKFKSTDELATAKPVKKGILKNFTISEAAATDSFAYEFKAWLKIPKKGIYRFYTYSDDGSKLLIDGHEVVTNDGSHGAQRADGKVALDEGFHQITVRYFEDYMGNELEVGFSSIGIRECPIPDNFLFTE
jgi:Predicted phosphohydrolases